MTKIKRNEHSLQIRAVSSHCCDVTPDQDFVLPLTLPPPLSMPQLRICSLIDRLTGQWGVPQLVPQPWVAAQRARRLQVGGGCAVRGSQLLSSCGAVSACAVRGEQHGFPLAAAWKREQWPWQNHSVPGWLTEPLAKTLERGEGNSVEQGEAGGEGRASICAQQRLQRQQILAEQGAHTEEKGMGERPKARLTIKKKKKAGGECGIWRGKIMQNLHSLRIIE